MKILLVKPYTELLVAQRLQESFLHLEPLELEIVAGGVPAEDDVRILDLTLEKNDPEGVFRHTIDTYQPDLIGLSGYSTTYQIVRKLAKITHRQRPETHVIVGGIHATLRPQDYAVSGVDLIVRGEGGTVIGEILNRLKTNKTPYFGDAVLSPRDPEFANKAAGPTPNYPPVEEIPAPRRDLVDRSRYFCVWTQTETRRIDTMFPRVASMRTSQGCPFSCSFCVIHQMMHRKYLQRTPESVVDEIASIEEDYIYFVDDEMFVNHKRVTRIAELLLERGIQKRYTSWARSDTIIQHPEVFQLWKKAGLDTVYVGLESMDDTRLKEYNKRTSLDMNRKAIAILKELDIMLHAAFIVHPDFDVSDFRKLERTIQEIVPAEITFTVLAPSPGTPMWEENKENYICDPFKYYDCMHTVLPTRLPLRRFYQHFGRLNQLALRSNPLRMRKVKMPPRDLIRAIVGGTRYIFSLYNIYKDYPNEIWTKSGNEQQAHSVWTAEK